jgi:hypothetical protein
MPSLKPAAATDNVRIESDPPGADARTAAGATCRTPCTLGVPLSDGNITVALNGYVPQTVPVQLASTTGGHIDDFGASNYPHVTPNPVFVELEPSPPVVVPDKPVKKKPPHVAAKKKPAVAQSSQGVQTTGSTTPAASTTTTTTTTTTAPWPTR